MSGQSADFLGDVGVREGCQEGARLVRPPQGYQLSFPQLTRTLTYHAPRSSTRSNTYHALHSSTRSRTYHALHCFSGCWSVFEGLAELFWLLSRQVTICNFLGRYVSPEMECVCVYVLLVHCESSNEHKP